MIATRTGKRKCASNGGNRRRQFRQEWNFLSLSLSHTPHFFSAPPWHSEMFFLPDGKKKKKKRYGKPAGTEVAIHRECASREFPRFCAQNEKAKSVLSLQMGTIIPVTAVMP